MNTHKFGSTEIRFYWIFISIANNDKPMSCSQRNRLLFPFQSPLHSSPSDIPFLALTKNAAIVSNVRVICDKSWRFLERIFPSNSWKKPFNRALFKLDFAVNIRWMRLQNAHSVWMLAHSMAIHYSPNMHERFSTSHFGILEFFS